MGHLKMPFTRMALEHLLDFTFLENFIEYLSGNAGSTSKILGARLFSPLHRRLSNKTFDFFARISVLIELIHIELGQICLETSAVQLKCECVVSRLRNGNKLVESKIVLLTLIISELLTFSVTNFRSQICAIPELDNIVRILCVGSLVSKIKGFREK